MSRGKERANELPVHKVIMVGSGGVGKSALTLQFMYDEVSVLDERTLWNVVRSVHLYSSWKTTNQQRRTVTVKG